MANGCQGEGLGLPNRCQHTIQLAPYRGLLIPVVTTSGLVGHLFVKIGPEFSQGQAQNGGQAFHTGCLTSLAVAIQSGAKTVGCTWFVGFFARCRS